MICEAKPVYEGKAAYGESAWSSSAICMDAKHGKVLHEVNADAWGTKLYRGRFK